MKKRIIVIAVLVAVIAAGVLAYRNHSNTPSDRIRLSGNIELTEIDIGFKMAGRLIERNFDEGDRVTKGAVVARLDREQLEKQREQAVAALAVAQAQLAQARTALNWQREALAADLDARHAELGAQQARLRELRTGSRPEEIAQAKAAVGAAVAEAERGRKDWDRAQTLYKDDDISTAQYDAARTRFESAEAALKHAREQLALVTAGPRSEVIEAAASQVQRAQAGVKAGEANALEVQRREQEIAARKADIARAEAQIAVIDTQLADAVVSAPASGVVLVKAADLGEVLAPGTTVLTIGDLDHPWMRGYINELDLGRVKIGSKARISTDSFPGKEYWGRVSFVASEAEFTPKQIQTPDERVKLVYRIKIDVDNQHGELKANMPADAEILLEQ